jgi:hypothetical protein
LKTTLPLSSVISAVRFSHLTWSNGMDAFGAEGAIDDFCHKFVSVVLGVVLAHI